MDNISREEAKQSIQLLVEYLKQNLKHTDLEKEDRSRGYRFIKQTFNLFKNGEEKIKILGLEIGDGSENHFGPTTRSEMELTASVFGYDCGFDEISREEIPGVSKEGKRQYWQKAIFTKK